MTTAHALLADYVLTLDGDADSGGTGRGGVVERGGVVMDRASGTILTIGTHEECMAAHPDAEVTRLDGKVLMPGLVNMHGHFYSALARGISLVGTPPTDFPSILGKLWWRLDRVLDADAIYDSAMVGLVDAIRAGVTTVFDHHASFHSIPDSLQHIARAAGAAGVRACLCYEVSDRDGAASAQLAIEESVRFLTHVRDSDAAAAHMLAGMFGLHASFTVSDATLRAAVEAEKPFGVGFHVHVAEAADDQAACEREHGTRVVLRLRDAGVLAPETIVAHCVHLSDEEWAVLARAGCSVAHNPESNLNNAVGVVNVHEVLRKGARVVLGTDGLSQSLWHTVRNAYFLPKHLAGVPNIMFGEVLTMLRNNAVRASQSLGVDVGVLRVGGAADVVAKPYQTPTPLRADNVLGHLVFAISDAPTTDSWCAARPLMRDSVLASVDEAAVMAAARQSTARVWANFETGLMPAVARARTAMGMGADGVGWVASGHGRTCTPRTGRGVSMGLSAEGTALLDELHRRHTIAYTHHRALHGYAPSPMLELAAVAKELGVGALWVKNEETRFGLPAFKVLGCFVAIVEHLKARVGAAATFPAEALFTAPAARTPEHKAQLAALFPTPTTFATATDGNHGRAVAWCAARLGQSAHITVPQNTVAERIREIESTGATVEVWPDNYDETVRAATAKAEANGWVLVSDTAFDGYTEIPKWIMSGYVTIWREAEEQQPTVRPTHVFVQAGVGGLATAAAVHFVGWERGDAPAPHLVCVEPVKAACFYESAKGDGERRFVTGDLDSTMVGLSCGEPSAVAWPVVRDVYSAYLSVPDPFAHRAQRMLHAAGIVSGASGAAGLAGLLAAMESEGAAELRARLGLGAESVVLLVNSEGDTDHAQYEAALKGEM